MGHSETATAPPPQNRQGALEVEELKDTELPSGLALAKHTPQGTAAPDTPWEGAI
jgi:hypothetical protein